MVAAALCTLCSLWLAQAGDPAGAGAPPTVPSARERAVAALSARLGIDASQVAFVDEWQVVWPSTALGVPEPDMAYATVLVPGSVILLGAGPTQHAYHTARSDRLVYAGVWEGGITAQLADLPALAEEKSPPRVEIDGTLVYVQGEALLYEGTVEPANLPRDDQPALVQGVALAPFIERNWKGASEGSATVRITGTPARPPASPLTTGVNPCAQLLAERIRIQPARAKAAGLVSLQRLLADPDRYHGSTVTVQGTLRSSFERCELEEPKPSAPPLPPVWVDGDLSGLPRAPAGTDVRLTRVEVTGLFERRLRFDGANGYGPKGEWGFRLVTRSLHALADVVDYADLVGKAAEAAGTLVAVRGQLFLGAGLSDLIALSPPDAARRDPGCLVTGDLSGVAIADQAALAAGLPVLVDGRLEVAATGEGFGRGGTRRLRIEATSVRLLETEELPAQEGASVGLEMVLGQEDGGSLLARSEPGAEPATIEKSVLGFAVRTSPEGRTRAVVTREEGSLAILQEDLAGGRTKVATAMALSDLCYSPSGRWLAAAADDQVRVYDAATCALAVGVPAEGGAATVIDWSPLGDALLVRTTTDGAQHAVIVEPSTGGTRVVEDEGAIIGWWPENARLLAVRDLRPGTPGDDGPVQTVLAVATDSAAAEGPLEVLQGRPGERVLGLVRNPKRPLAALVTTAREPSVAADLYLIAIGSESPRRMCYMGASEIRAVHWSDDGERLAFLARQGTVWHAVLMDAAGRKLVDVRGALPVRPEVAPATAASGDHPGRDDPGDL